MSKSNSADWNSNGGSPDIQTSVNILETDPPARGRSIPAKQAIELMRNLWLELQANRLSNLKEDLIKSMDNPLPEYMSSNDKIIKETKDLLYKSIETLEEMLKYSFSLTVDRAIVEGLLEPKNCKGIRLYPCMTKTGAPQSIKKTFSLVAVGIDELSNDLGFTYDSTKHDLIGIPQIEDCSLTAEYAFTLGTNPFDASETTRAAIQPYVLFKYANPYFTY